MYDRYNRNITYLRISVTDRCNLRCQYCMPESGIEWMGHSEILTFEEIAEVVKTGVSLGIKRVRLTGGEPLVRKGIVTLVEMLATIPGIEEVSMTTNGVLLEKFAVDLAKAGLKRVNISLDTTNPEKFREITRGGNVQDVIRGIDSAMAAGLTPIKLNCVVWNSAGEPDARLVADFAKSRGLRVQYIHQMDLETGDFSLVEGGNGGNCPACNRLRLTAKGDLKPCLFHSGGYNVRKLGIEEAFRQAAENKPAAGTHNLSGKFYNIGG